MAIYVEFTEWGERKAVIQDGEWVTPYRPLRQLLNAYMNFVRDPGPSHWWPDLYFAEDVCDRFNGQIVKKANPPDLPDVDPNAVHNQ